MSPQCLPGSFPQTEILVAPEGKCHFPILLPTPPPPNVAEDGRPFLDLFCRRLKAAALSPAGALLALAQRKLQEVGELSGPRRPRQVGSSRERPLLPWLAVPPEPPPHPTTPFGAGHTHTQRVGMGEPRACTPLRRVPLPGGRRWRQGRGVWGDGERDAGRRSDWLRRRPLPAPRAPRSAPSPLPPAASEPLPGGRTRRGGTVSPPRIRPRARG